MIKNPDGTPYKTSGDIRQFNPQSQEHDLFNLWDEEAIRQGGSPVYYYEMFVQSGTVDPVYMEDRGKIFSDHPVELYCYYEPIPSQNYVNAFGIDSPDEMLFEFNYKDVVKRIGHPPKTGSRLYTPHLGENWQIVQKTTGEFRLWGALRMTVLCQKFQESLTTKGGEVTKKKPDFKINDFGN